MQSLFDSAFISIYNVIFTSLPVLAIGIFEQDVSAATSLAIPELYAAGPLNKFFGRKTFFISLFRGAMHSILIYFVYRIAVRLGFQVDAHAYLYGL